MGRTSSEKTYSHGCFPASSISAVNLQETGLEHQCMSLGMYTMNTKAFTVITDSAADMVKRQRLRDISR